MNNKKGFTLVELLAVIAILAILVIIALPNIMNMFNGAKKKTFVSEAQVLYKIVEQDYVKDAFTNSGKRLYVKSPTDNCSKELDGQIRDDLYYYIQVESNGKISKFYVYDGNYQFASTKYNLMKTDIKDVSEVSELTDDYVINITCDGVSTVSGNMMNVTELVVGTTLNTTLKKLAGASSPTYNTEDTNIKRIQRAYTMPASVTKKKISSDDSEYPVYAWYKDNTIYIYSEDSVIYLNKDSSYTFTAFAGLETFNMNIFDTSNVTNMKGLFKGCSGLTSLNLLGINTSKVTNMQEMFYSCRNLLSLDLSGFDTSKVTKMGHMFRDLISLTSLNLTNFVTTNVRDMQSMFKNCDILPSIDLSNFDTSNVTNMSFMFDNCATVTSLDVSSFDTSNVVDTHSMFDHCFKLVTIYASDMWNVSNVTNSQHMFRYSSKIKGSSGTTTSGNPTDASYARVDNPPDSPGYLTYKAHN